MSTTRPTLKRAIYEPMIAKSEQRASSDQTTDEIEEKGETSLAGKAMA